ncbi:GNAT family N-acetyltransferase [Halioxenophilus sp. WMMB6]|uniref:GNAT family N-acetyltransferase n=1 Tax=Halioxenophilus sp. WMMB6 TaxID=3073815 RepID=UPI00295F1395|nr:GNAT family N-acetyltransferase [Halioxenophilus sp. WMMB6]
MIIEPVTIEFVDWQAEQNALLAIRRAVFIEEQGVSEEEEIDGRDEQYQQVLCRVGSEQAAVGCARISAEGKIGRVAILQPFRQFGLGARLMQFCIEAVTARQQTPHLDAQVTVIPFYERLGFLATGEEFLDANIPHKKMHFALASFLAPNDHTTSDAEKHAYSQRSLTSLSYDCDAKFAELASENPRDLLILCPESLNHWLASGSRVEVLKEQLLNSNMARVFIVFDERQPDLSILTQLIALAHKLPSKLQLRCAADEAAEFPEFKMISNNSSYTTRALGDERLPDHCETRRLNAQQMQIEREQFFLVWEHQTWSNPYLREIKL